MTIRLLAIYLMTIAIKATMFVARYFSIAALLVLASVNAVEEIGSVHMVGTDRGMCEELGWDDPDCDAPYSLHARLYDDGTVSGNWKDEGEGFLEIEPNCIKFGVGKKGNKAVVSGIVKRSESRKVYPIDSTAVTVVKDGRRGDMYTFIVPADEGVDCNNFDITRLGRLAPFDGEVTINKP